MRLFLALLLILPFELNAATTFTEFYCQSGGSQLNAGSTTDNAAVFTATGGFWTNSTCTFAKVGLNPSGFSVGDWASVYPDAATVAVFVGRIISTNATSITVNTTNKCGTAPVDDTTGATSIKVGGAWLGPNTNSATAADCNWPMGTFGPFLTNNSGNVPCLNFLGTSTYWVTNAMTDALAGPKRFEGYTVTPHDGGMATINGNAVAKAGYILITASGANTSWSNIKFDGNGNSSTAVGILSSGVENEWRRCAFFNMRSSGLQLNSFGFNAVFECEFATNNISNSSGHGGIRSSGSGFVRRCIFRDTSGNVSDGFWSSGSDFGVVNCVFYRISGAAVRLTSATPTFVSDCDFYNNTQEAIYLVTPPANCIELENCLFFKNGYAMRSAAGNTLIGSILNYAVGSGTQANTIDIDSNISSGRQAGVVIDTAITYTADETPWIDPDNGNFRLKPTASLVLASGRGAFLQTLINSPTNTVAFPDIGAVQSASTNAAAAGGTTAHTFAQ